MQQRQRTKKSLRKCCLFFRELPNVKAVFSAVGFSLFLSESDGMDRRAFSRCVMCCCHRPFPASFDHILVYRFCHMWIRKFHFILISGLAGARDGAPVRSPRAKEGSAPPEHRPCNGRSQGRPMQLWKHDMRKAGRQSPPVPPGQRIVWPVSEQPRGRRTGCTVAHNHHHRFHPVSGP